MKICDLFRRTPPQVETTRTMSKDEAARALAEARKSTSKLAAHRPMPRGETASTDAMLRQYGPIS